MDFGTINGIPISQQMLDEYALEFEKDWDPSEFKVVQTERGRELNALKELNIPIEEIAALERLARHLNRKLSEIIHISLQNAILYPNFIENDWEPLDPTLVINEFNDQVRSTMDESDVG